MVRFLTSTSFSGFQVRRLLEGSAYSDLSVNGAVLIRGRPVMGGLFEAWCNESPTFARKSKRLN